MYRVWTTGQVRDWALRTQQKAKETLALFSQSLQFRPGAPWRSFLSISQHKAIGSAGRHMNEMFVEFKPLYLNTFFFHFSNNTTELVFSNPPLTMKIGVQGGETTCQHSASSLVMSPTFKLKSDQFKASISSWLYFQYSSDLLNNNNYAPFVFPQVLCTASR